MPLSDASAPVFQGVPVIDISALVAFQQDSEFEAALEQPQGALKELVDAVAAAATEWGFFYIAHHGLSAQQLSTFKTKAKEFFALPKSVKDTIRRSPDNQRGFYDDETTKNKKDWKETFDYASAQDDLPATEHSTRRLLKDQNRWLAEDLLPGFKQTVRQYYDSLEVVASRLVKIFAAALGAPVHVFDEYFRAVRNGQVVKDQNGRVRLNFYPVSPDPENTMGVYHHTDGAVLTLLLQDDNVTSLQVFHRDFQRWVFVPPVENTFVVNIGDLIQVWSNDRFIAPLHRVVSSGSQSRLSAPFFYLPSYDAEIKPVITKDSNEKPKYHPFNFGDFRQTKVLSNIIDIGREDLQITQFKVAVE